MKSEKKSGGLWTKIKVIVFILVIVGGVAAILVHNKSKLQAKSNDESINSYPVSVTKAELKTVSNSLELVGTITGDNDVAVVAEAKGRVLNVYAKIGDYVSKGSTIIQLDGELKDAAFKTAEVNYEKAKKDYERYEALFNEKSIPISRLEAAKLALQAAESQLITARREFTDTKITAPISGVITARSVDVGNYVSSGSVTANIVDISKLKVKLNVAEKDAFKLKAGDNVEITTDVYPGVVFNGKIATISDKGDEAHTYPVEVVLSNSKQNPLKAGMFGRVKFVSLKTTDSIFIPREALVGSIKDAKVFVVDNGIARERKITIGSTYDDMLQVLSGLNNGEVIVINGQNNLKDNFNVDVVN
jgi:RND family efflux transporter MFP subunit